jgi:hypothetical protein
MDCSMSPNHSIQRTGASRSAQFVFVAQWRLAPVADAGRWAYNKHTQMKIAYIIGCTLLLFVLGCKHETRSAQSAPAGSKTISDGGYTWTLGAATMNGTNVPLSNITVRAITNQAPK